MARHSSGLGWRRCPRHDATGDGDGDGDGDFADPRRADAIVGAAPAVVTLRGQVSTYPRLEHVVAVVVAVADAAEATATDAEPAATAASGLERQ